MYGAFALESVTSLHASDVTLTSFAGAKPMQYPFKVYCIVESYKFLLLISIYAISYPKKKKYKNSR